MIKSDFVFVGTALSKYDTALDVGADSNTIKGENVRSIRRYHIYKDTIRSGFTFYTIFNSLLRISLLVEHSNDFYK